MNLLLTIICWALNIYYFVLIARIILSWITRLPEPLEPLARGVRALTDPVLTPLRRAIPALRAGPAAIDFSPLIVFFGIILLQSVLCR